MDTKMDTHYQFPPTVGNAHGLESEYVLIPPLFGPAATTAETKADAMRRHVRSTAYRRSVLDEMKGSHETIEKILQNT